MVTILADFGTSWHQNNGFSHDLFAPSGMTFQLPVSFQFPFSSFSLRFSAPRSHSPASDLHQPSSSAKCQILDLGYILGIIFNNNFEPFQNLRKLLEFPTNFYEHRGFAASKTYNLCRLSYHIQPVPAGALPFLRRPPLSTDPTTKNGSKQGSLESQELPEEPQIRPSRPGVPHSYASLL